MAVTAQFKADFASFFRGVEEAQVHLKSFEEDAVKINKSLDRMGDSFSGKKIIQEATLMAKAIEDAGGTAKLTDAELARVGKTAAEAAEKMRALGMEVPKNLQDLADATAGAGKETQALSVSVGDMVKAYVSAEAIMKIVTGAYHALKDGITACITSASEAEEADRSLLAALEAQGTAVPSVVEAYQGYAKALQQTTIYSDDAVTAAQRLLAQVGGVMPRDMEKATLAAANLAAALGIDLPNAAMMVAKAATGSTEALNKYGIETETADGKTQEFGATLDGINAKFAGAATAAADTYAGRLTQLGNAWDNVQEAVGRAVIQNETVNTLMEEITGVISGQTGELEDNATANNLVSDAVILLAKSASVAAEGIQFMGTALLAGRTAVDAFAMGITHAYSWMQKIEEWTQRKVFETLGTDASKMAMDKAADNLKWADAQLVQLESDMKAAVQTNTEWEAGVNAMQTRLGELTDKLEATRGKTRELTATQDENADAMKRHTGALGEQLIALEDVAKGVERMDVGFTELDTRIADWGLNTKVAGLSAFGSLKAASTDAMNEIITGADGAAAAVFKITTEAQGAASALQGLSAVQSGATLELPHGGSGEAYAPWHVATSGGYLAMLLSQRYGTGVLGKTAAPPMFADGGIVTRPTLGVIAEAGPEAVIPLALLGGRGGGGGATTVILQSGAVTLNYPIMDDPQAKDRIGRLVGDAIVSRLTRAGARV